MAEAYLKKIGGNKFEADSAGIEPGVLNPYAVEVLKEDGIDISSHPTNDVFEYFKQGRIFHYVVTVCDGASAARCPIFPGLNEKIAWDLPDPSSFQGSHEEKLAYTRQIRDQIKERVLTFIEYVNDHP